MNYRRILHVFLLLLPLVLGAQDKVTLSGYVKDTYSGETLIGASVFIPSEGLGTTSNEYGYYALTIPKGTYSVSFSYLGYETKTMEVVLDGQKKLDVELAEEAENLEEVVILSEAEDVNVRSTEMSVNKLGMTTIKKIPAFLGEIDVVRSILLLPGVTTVGEGATGFNVRGGSIDQNLILLDEAPVYNSSHLFGFFSVFNPDAVKDVKLFKGGIPVRYGGRLSSILDVRMKEGNNRNFEVNGGVGSIFSRLSIEGPLVKDKASFIIAGRRSYIDVLAKPFLPEDLKGSVLNFYDFTAKTNYKIDDKNRIYLSGYLGKDNFGFGENAGFNWGNQTTTFRWNHLFSDRLFSNFTTYYSKYDYSIQFGSGSENKFNWDAAIANYAVKADLSYFLNPSNQITFGGQSIYYEFSPGEAVGISVGETSNFGLPKKYAVESSAFLENEQTFNDILSMNYGLRFSTFTYMGKGTKYTFEPSPIVGGRKIPSGSQEFTAREPIQTYYNFEPRISAKIQLSPASSLKASYNRTAQYIHLISNTTAASPVDVWTPSTNNIKPQLADQVGLGYFQNFSNNTYKASTEVYYKEFQNLVDYVDGADLFVNPLLEAELLSGIGRAYGLELQVEKKKGNLTGWISYVLSRSERKVEGISKSKWYPSRFDQLHTFNATALYQFNPKWTVSGVFVLNSGTPTTFPTDRFEQQGYVIPYVKSGLRNNYRIPVYHRMDLSATWTPRPNSGRKWSGEWVFSLYNVYNKRNPFSIFFRQQKEAYEPGEALNTEAVRFSVIGSIVPAVSYNFKFK